KNGELVGRHQGIVYKVCFIYELDFHLRQDLFQEIMIRRFDSFSEIAFLYIPAIVVFTILLYFANRAYAKKMYGNHINHLKAIVNEMNEILVFAFHSNLLTGTFGKFAVQIADHDQNR
ncbi:MAG: hypothetical protein ABR502_09515, partial [Chitinophagaceae bacterium]